MTLRTLPAPLGNLDTFVVGARRVERVVVRSDELAKRVVRLTTSVGDVGIRFDDERRLHDGDVLYADDELVIIIGVETDDLFVIRPRDIGQALAIGHALGNRHLPAQFDGDTILVRYDPLVEELLREKSVPFSRETRVVAEPFRHAHAPHTHE
ncbi:MAG TPA: urease accessory protein UreE [Candidatus Acidoferrales bacterium]|nr:urease accessory protein UreE [Candidatus Acidoferrales bacterium]